MPKYGTRNALTRYLKKTFFLILNQHPKICVIAKFCERKKKNV